MRKWKILGSKEVFRHPRLTLMEDEIILFNGTRSRYLKFKDFANSATLICRRTDGKILLQREYSHPPRAWIYQFPGGKVSFGENIRKGANRELMEEAKLYAKTLKLLGTYYFDNRRSEAKIYVFLATKLVSQPKEGDAEEEIESYWHSEKQIEGLIRQGKITNSTALATWALYKIKNKG